MSLIQRDDMVQQFSTATSDSPLRNSVLRPCLDARSLRLQTGRYQLDYVDVKFRVVVKYRSASGEVSRNCCVTHSDVGWAVTLHCRTLRQPCSMTRKPYSSLKVNVGTVKKSNATITCDDRREMPFSADRASRFRAADFADTWQPRVRRW